jgi:Kae1-associated kinase Bud32
MKALFKGAEAVIYSQKIFNKTIFIKNRISKSYRNPKLDQKIIKVRNKQEATLINKVKILGINTPSIYYLGKNTIYLEKLNNSKKHHIYLSKIGSEIAKLHNGQIIHGDLNLINIITQKNKIYFIDFGLGYISNKIEDKATDLLVFKKTLKSSSKTSKYWEEILLGYKKDTNNKEIIPKIFEIEKRGRYL